MLANILDILSRENHTMELEAALEMDSVLVQEETFPIARKAPVSLRLENVENKSLLIRGEVALTVLIPCARCLEECPVEFSLEIVRELDIPSILAQDREAGGEKPYLAGYDLDVDKLVYLELLLNWPMKVLCGEDCRGLCKFCGKNLNEGVCGCPAEVSDPRMARVLDVFQEFKEV